MKVKELALKFNIVAKSSIFNWQKNCEKFGILDLTINLEEDQKWAITNIRKENLTNQWHARRPLSLKSVFRAKLWKTEVFSQPDGSGLQAVRGTITTRL